MTKEDMFKLRKLLGAIHSRLKNITDDEIWGWYLVLKPYEYTDIKKAVIAFARQSSFVPSPSEIAILLESWQTNKENLTEHKDLRDVYKNNLRIYAKVCGIAPPQSGLSGEDLKTWFNNARTKLN